MIDVIIPLYNSKKSLNETLISIAMQDNVNDIVVTLVDDCSKDNYDNIINLFKDKIKLNYYRLDKNSGPGVARQYGIDHTNNPYILFLDSDDIMVNAISLSSLVNEIDSDIDIIFGGVFSENADGMVDSTNKDRRVLHGKLFKRSFLDKFNIRFYNEYRGEDTGFLAKCLISNAKVKYSDIPVYVYRYVKSSITHDKTYLDNFNCLDGLINCTVDAFDSVKVINIEEAAFYSFFAFYNGFDLYYNSLLNNKNDILIKLKKIVDIYVKYNKYIDVDFKNIVYKYYFMSDDKIKEFIKLIKNS